MYPCSTKKHRTTPVISFVHHAAARSTCPLASNLLPKIVVHGRRCTCSLNPSRLDTLKPPHFVVKVIKIDDSSQQSRCSLGEQVRSRRTELQLGQENELSAKQASLAKHRKRHKSANTKIRMLYAGLLVGASRFKRPCPMGMIPRMTVQFLPAHMTPPPIAHW